MSSEQARGLIEHARVFHRELEVFYHRLENIVQKERVKMLLEYLEEHERRMGERLRVMETQLSRPVLDTWFKFSAEPHAEHLVASFKARPDMSSSEVICLALDLDEYLLKMFKEAAVRAPDEQVREAFLSLYEEGKNERAKLVLDMFEPE